MIDYHSQDFTKTNEEYDFVFDTVGKSSFFKCFNILKPGGIYISSDLGYMAQNMFLPLITPVIKPLISNKKTVFPYPVDVKYSLKLRKKLMEKGEYQSVIDKDYAFEDIIDAYRYVEKGHKLGNVAINV